MAGRKTLETLTAADQIVDALDVARHERERIDAHVESNGRDKDANDDDEEKAAEAATTRRTRTTKKALENSPPVTRRRRTRAEDDSTTTPPTRSWSTALLIRVRIQSRVSQGFPPNPLLMGQSPERYALSAIEKVRSADLEQAVLALPFSSALTLLEYLGGWLEAGEKTELTCRLASLIVRLHYVQLGATAGSRGVLLRLRPLLRRRAAELRDVVGFNLAGMSMWENHLKEGGGRDQEDKNDDEDEKHEREWG